MLEDYKIVTLEGYFQERVFPNHTAYTEYRKHRIRCDYERSKHCRAHKRTILLPPQRNALQRQNTHHKNMQYTAEHPNSILPFPDGNACAAKKQPA